MERMLTEMAAGLSRMCSQSTPRKKLYDFKSSSPRWDPARRSASQQNLNVCMGIYEFIHSFKHGV